MALIATNHLALIIEFAILMHIGILLLLNFLPLNSNVVYMLSLVLGAGIPMLSHHEFTHPYGPIAIFVIVTSWAMTYMLQGQGVRTSNLKLLVLLETIGIAIFGAVVHRDFLIMFILGILIGFFILDKTNGKGKHEHSILTPRNMLLVVVAMFLLFGIMEGLSQVLHMEIISPLSRIDRMNANQFSSLKLVIDNTNLFGHSANATYWGNSSMGNSD